MKTDVASNTSYINQSFQPDTMSEKSDPALSDPDRKMSPSPGPPTELKSVLAGENKLEDSKGAPPSSTISSRIHDACGEFHNLPQHAWSFFKKSKAEPIMGLFALAFYMPMPFVQNLMMEKVCLEKYPPSVCLNKTINETIESENQDIVGQYLLYHYLARQLPAVILSLLMGNWSDVYGRRYMICLPITGNIITMILYILNAHYAHWPPEAIILSGIPAGLTGDYAGFMLGLFGFVKDAHIISDLSLRISLADGTEMLASQVGPLIGGQLFEHHGYNAVFGMGIAFLLLNILVAVLLIEDKDFKQATVRKKLHDFFQPKGIAESVRSVFRKREQNKRAYIFVVLLTVMIVFFGYFGHSEIVYMYTRIKLQWTVIDVANYNAAIGGCSTAGLVFVLPVLLYLIKLNDVTMGLIGHVGFIGFYLGTAFATTTVAMFAVCSFQIIANMGFVTLRSCISKCVESNEIGRVMSMYAVLQALFRNLGQTLATQVYLATKNTYIGAFFILAASLFLICISAYTWMYFDMKRTGFKLDEQESADPEEKHGPTPIANHGITHMGF